MNHPVVNVSWNDAAAFCVWLSKKEGKKYRLPTEAEWEYACRAGTTTRYSFGNDPEGLVKYANSWDAGVIEKWPAASNRLKGNDGYIFTAPVGSFLPNPFGLYDMHGNVNQWCADWFGKDYYSVSGVDDPQGPATGTQHVLRGGSFVYHAAACRCAARGHLDTADITCELGFRIVLER